MLKLPNLAPGGRAFGGLLGFRVSGLRMFKACLWLQGFRFTEAMSEALLEVLVRCLSAEKV